ncbi:MAG TPA: adenosylmethionine decarboxylase [Caldisericia bacterium]|nr:adenosylmethionine decarboxylase [Caldisericia bacterium]HPF49750.1 adenosylmethionine decarboxylase [Caldisericia bacterium]HPI84312.1 adenosylmethionine decarboxylase [Caldisericia bacterium]HPQ93739.1 adenosylmethionine decarboxylase [Caldisericia bacterium]HRV74837.1 adenosylmethionine decarboxylase [Caldisericia bacterium]
MQTNGRHLLCELSGCNPNLIGDVDFARRTLFEAANNAGAEVMEMAFHRFFPQGVSGVVVIAESHLSIHSWPECGYAALDIYTCGDHTSPERALEYCSKAFEASGMKLSCIERGLPGNSGDFTHVLKEPIAAV